MSDRRTLESWKAIASYLGRTEKTCRKWEHELGLPVHRLDDSAKAHVFAYADEIDRWKEKLEASKDRNGAGFLGLKGLSRGARLRLLAGSALMLVAVAGFLVWQFALRAPAPERAPARKGIAILAFTDLSPKKEYEYLCDGMAETLIDALNKVEGLRVPSRTSSFYFKGKDAPPQEIGKKLNVEYVLEASVQADGDKLRVIPRLLNAADGLQLWSGKFDRSREDIFAVEDDIAQGVAKALEVKVLGASGAPIVKPGTQNLEAYNLYLTGQYYMRQGWFSYGRAIEFFEKAAAKDPNYAEAYAGAAFCYFKQGRVALARPSEVYPKAKAAALKALAIDPRNPRALGTLGNIKLAYDWDFVGTEEFVRKAIRDNPGSSFLHEVYATLLLAVGRFEEGLAETELAFRQDALSQDLELGGTPAYLYIMARKYDLAVERLKEAIERDPQNTMNHIMLLQAYLAMGRYEDAKAINRQRREIQGHSSWPDAGSQGNAPPEPWCAIVHALTGNRARAHEILNNLKSWGFDKDSKGLWYGYHHLAWTYAALGEKDDAFYWLEKAYQERTGAMYTLKANPLADPLRGDPRFNDLLRRIGLEK